MQLTHRPVEEKDISIVCGFPQNEEELFFLFPNAVYPLTQTQLGDAIARRSDSTIVEADNQVVGFANFYKWDLGGRCSIGNVIVSPSVRGHGIGRYLINSMIKLALTEHQAREIGISCFNRNVIGLLLYSKLGFRPYDIEERKDLKGDRIALIHMLWRPDADKRI
jgi:RimJ/RimL family protein N-acetyltransferase